MIVRQVFDTFSAVLQAGVSRPQLFLPCASFGIEVRTHAVMGNGGSRSDVDTIAAVGSDRLSLPGHVLHIPDAAASEHCIATKFPR